MRPFSSCWGRSSFVVYDAVVWFSILYFLHLSKPFGFPILGFWLWRFGECELKELVRVGLGKTPVGKCLAVLGRFDLVLKP